MQAFPGSSLARTWLCASAWPHTGWCCARRGCGNQWCVFGRSWVSLLDEIFAPFRLTFLKSAWGWEVGGEIYLTLWIVFMPFYWILSNSCACFWVTRWRKQRVSWTKDLDYTYLRLGWVVAPGQCWWVFHWAGPLLGKENGGKQDQFLIDVLLKK